MPFTRNQYPVLLDANALAGIKNADGYDLARVDKSTQYSLAWNGQKTEKKYIDAANSSNEVTGFQTSMGQEIILEPKNRMFRLIDDFAWKFKKGADAIVPCVLARPMLIGDKGEYSPKYALAAMWKEATVVPNSLETVEDGKYSFDIDLNGDPTYGYITKDDDGNFTFTEGNPPTDNTPPAEEEEGGGIETQSLSSTLKASKATSSK